MTFDYLLLIVPAQIAFLCLIVLALSAYAKRWTSETHIAVAVALTIIGAVGALYFWLALTSISLANGFRVVCLIAITAAAIQAYQRRLYSWDILFPISALAIGSLLLCLIVVIRGDPENMLRSVATLWRDMPIDNEIPYRFAMNLWHGKIEIPLLPEWHASDRPPLQSSLFLLLQAGLKPNPIRYEICSIVLQMTALPALWCLLRTVRVGSWPAMAIVAIAFMTPMTIMNGVFVWPKLIAAAFLCCAAVFLLSQLPRERPYLAATLFGVAIALASLCHGTSIFTLPAVAILALMQFRGNVLRTGAIAAAAFTILYLPWIGFQKFYDPPGDRLLKYHLAGVVQYTTEPLIPLLKQAYAGKTPAQIYERRQFGVTDIVFGLIPESFAALTATMIDYVRGATPPPQLLSNLRDREFLRMVPSMGFIGLLCPLLIAGLFLRRIRPFTILVLTTLLFWVATIYDPFGMTPHAASYSMQFFTIAAIGTVLTAISPWLLLPVAAAHALAIASVYLI